MIFYMKCIFPYIACLLLFFNCAKEKNKLLLSDKVFYLTESNMPILQQISEYEKIELPEEECMASCFYVYNDTTLIIFHNNPDPYWVSIMNLNTKEIIANFLKKGSGPNEMIYCYSNLRNNRLLIDDHSLKKMVIFNIDSIELLGQSYNPHMYWLSNDYYKSFDILTDTSFIFYNSWYLDNCGIEITKNIPELIVTNANANYKYEPPLDALLVNQVNGADILANIQDKSVCLAYYCKPQFSFLNTDLDTIKIVWGPEPMEKYEYVDRGKLGGLFPALHNEYTIRSFCSDNYIFVGNARLHNITKEKIKEKRSHNQPEIFKFDWKGNLHARYQVSNFYELSGFSESTNTLYLTIRDEDYELNLFKVKL